MIKKDFNIYFQVEPNDCRDTCVIDGTLYHDWDIVRAIKKMEKLKKKYQDKRVKEFSKIVFKLKPFFDELDKEHQMLINLVVSYKISLESALRECGSQICVDYNKLRKEGKIKNERKKI